MSGPLSPGFGGRRKGWKHPTLPLSAFTPPNTGTGEQFPLPASPSTIHPTKVVDANVIIQTNDLTKWTEETALVLKDKASGVVVSLIGAPEGSLEKLVSEISSSATSSTTPILAILVPFDIYSGIPAEVPVYLSTTASPPIVLASTYSQSTPIAIDTLKWALEKGFNVDLDVQSDLRSSEAAWETLEDFFSKAIPVTSPTPPGNVILSNILPPPDDFSLPIVKLLTHPTYRDYQSRTAALSLNANIYIKFIPPIWGAVTPPTPAPASAPSSADTPTIDSGVDVGEDGVQVVDRDSYEKKEWKKRIKMYIGPALEAFGFERIIYGSSPSPLSHSASNAGDWYELARESFAELGVEHDTIDAVFGQNALKVYTKS
ncbi:hypothetical protein ABKN59_009292 [Abortiporus biennis]